MLSIIEKFKGKPILIVTNTPGMIERGADINFKTVEGKQSYETLIYKSLQQGHEQNHEGLPPASPSGFTVLELLMSFFYKKYLKNKCLT